MQEVSFWTCRLYKVLGNPIRYKILRELARSPQTPTDLAKAVRRSLPAVSRALDLLHWARLVCYTTQGHHVVYALPADVDVDRLLNVGEAFTRRHRLEVPPPPLELTCRSAEDPYWLRPRETPRTGTQ